LIIYKINHVIIAHSLLNRVHKINFLKKYVFLIMFLLQKMKQLIKFKDRMSKADIKIHTNLYYIII